LNIYPLFKKVHIDFGIKILVKKFAK